MEALRNQLTHLPETTTRHALYQLSLAENIGNLVTPNIVVIGDLIVDEWDTLESTTVCRELGRGYRTGKPTITNLGGAGNLLSIPYTNLGFATVIGDDMDGNRALVDLIDNQSKRVGNPIEGNFIERVVNADKRNLRVVIEDNRATPSNHRFQVEHGAVLTELGRGITVKTIPSENISVESEAEMIAALNDMTGNISPDERAIVISDYGRGVCTPAIYNALSNIQALSIFVDTRPSETDYRKYDIPNGVLTPNRGEAHQMLQFMGYSNEEIAFFDRHPSLMAEKFLHEFKNIKAVMLTRDKDGLVWMDRQRDYIEVPAFSRGEGHPSGCGDIINSTLAMCESAVANGQLTRKQSLEAASLLAGKGYLQEGTSGLDQSLVASAIDNLVIQKNSKGEKSVFGIPESVFAIVYEKTTALSGGAFRPELAAKELYTRLSGIGVETSIEELSQLLSQPEVFAYNDTFEFIQQVALELGSDFSFYTAGEPESLDGGRGYQQAKIDRLLDNAVTQEVLPQEALELSTQVMCGYKKSAVLAGILEENIGLFRAKYEGLVIIDDRPKELQKVIELASRHGVKVDAYLIDRENKHKGVELGGIKRIKTLNKIKAENIKGRFVLCDLDYTLIDHSKTRIDFSRRVANLVAERTSNNLLIEP